MTETISRNEKGQFAKGQSGNPAGRGVNKWKPGEAFAPKKRLAQNRNNATAQNVVGRPFPEGVSGNPMGRPRGSRNKFSEALVLAFAESFDKHGKRVIAEVLKKNPTEYLKLAASFVPKQVEAEVEIGLSHEERVRQREKLIAEFEGKIIDVEAD